MQPPFLGAVLFCKQLSNSLFANSTHFSVILVNFTVSLLHPFMPHSSDMARTVHQLKNWSELVGYVKSCEKSKEDKALKFLLSKELETCTQWVSQNAPHLLDQVEEQIQNTAILYFKWVLDGKIVHETDGKRFVDLFSYLFAMTHKQKNWLKNVENSRIEEWNRDPLLAFFLQEERNWVHDIWKLNSDACQDVMKMMTFYHYPLRKIVVEMGYKSSEMARTRHFQCFEGLKRAISTKPQYFSLFRKFLSYRG